MRLAELAEAAGGRWTPRTPAGRVVYGPPAVSEFGAGEADGGVALRAYFAGLCSEDFAEEGTAWLPAGRVYGDGVVLSADGRLLARDAGPDFGKPFEQHWLLRHDRLRAPVAAPAGPLAVVAPHGASLANLVFCAPGTRVVELFARDYVNPCYWRVAALGRLDYRPVVAAGPGAPREERTVNGTDIAVAVGAVLAAAG